MKAERSLGFVAMSFWNACLYGLLFEYCLWWRRRGALDACQNSAMQSGTHALLEGAQDSLSASLFLFSFSLIYRTTWRKKSQSVTRRRRSHVWMTTACVSGECYRLVLFFFFILKEKIRCTLTCSISKHCVYESGTRDMGQVAATFLLLSFFFFLLNAVGHAYTCGDWQIVSLQWWNAGSPPIVWWGYVTTKHTRAFADNTFLEGTISGCQSGSYLCQQWQHHPYLHRAAILQKKTL